MKRHETIVIAIIVACFVAGFFLGTRFTKKCVEWAFDPNRPEAIMPLCKL